MNKDDPPLDAGLVLMAFEVMILEMSDFFIFCAIRKGFIVFYGYVLVDL
jgi:hypothetical protein